MYPSDLKYVVPYTCQSILDQEFDEIVSAITREIEDKLFDRVFDRDALYRMEDDGGCLIQPHVSGRG